MSDHRRFWRLLLVVAAGALLLRVGYIVVAKSGEAPVGDQIYYHAQAGANADGRWFRDATDDGHTAEHPPLTALALTPTAWTADRINGTNSVMANRLTISLFGVGAVIAVGLLGRRVAGDRAGLIAAALAAVNPNFLVNDGHIMSESLATLAVALAILCAYRCIANPTLASAMALGAMCGVAALARQELLLLAPLMVVPVVLGLRAVPLRRRFALIGGAAAAVVLVVGPWIGWNLARFEKSVTFSTNDGITICGANLRQVYFGTGTGLWALDCALLDVPAGDRSVASAALRRRGLEFIGDHLDRLPIVVAARIGRVWSVYAPGQMVDYNTGEGRERWMSWSGVAAWWLFVPLAVVGAVRLRKRGTPLWPLTSQFVIVTLTAATVYGLVRFRVPADVAVVVLAAVALDAWASRSRPEQAPGAAPVHSSPDRDTTSRRNPGEQ